MAFCNNCGSQLKPGAKFCENCGALAEEEKTPESTGAAPVYLLRISPMLERHRQRRLPAVKTSACRLLF